MDAYMIMIFIVSLIFTLSIFAAIINIIVRRFKTQAQWKRSINSPVSNVTAKAISKRISKQNQLSLDGLASIEHMESFERYHITFEIENSGNVELEVSLDEYETISEGDCGQLAFQGTLCNGWASERCV